MNGGGKWSNLEVFCLFLKSGVNIVLCAFKNVWPSLPIFSTSPAFADPDLKKNILILDIINLFDGLLGQE